MPGITLPPDAQRSRDQLAKSEAERRRTLCVYLSRLRIEMEARLRPDPLGRPIVVFDPNQRLRPVLEAPEDGPPCGTPLREAQSRWPDLSYRADAPADYAQAVAPVLDILAELSPTVEWNAETAKLSLAIRHDPAARYAALLDGTGLEALYGSEARLGRLIAREVWERTGHQALVGIADGRYAAWLAAQCGEIVPAGADAAYLAPLPVTRLPLLPTARDRLAALGVTTLGEFSRLPANSLRHRFGPEGVVARALAAGHDEGPLRPRPTPLQLQDSLDLEWVETNLDRLLFLLKSLADRLSIRLGHHGLGSGRLRVVWLLDGAGLTTGDDLALPDEDGYPSPGTAADDGTVVSNVRLAEPAGSGGSLLEHLRWHVEGLRPETFRDPLTGQQRGVRGIVIEAEELAPLGGRQLALLPGEDGRAASPERLLAGERALARLMARWGEAAVQQAVLVGSRRPERAYGWREPSVQALLPVQAPARRTGRTPHPVPRPSAPQHRQPPAPPIWLAATPADVQVDRGGRLSNGRRRPGTVTQGRHVRRIVAAVGPWRLVERWAAEPVARDAYHVVLADGAACWLVHDRLADRWQMFGTFD